MACQQPNPKRLIVREVARSHMWQRLWGWLLSPPSDQPDPLDGDMAHHRSTGLDFEESSDAVL